MIHPYTELRFISPEKGYGVVALKPIPRGTITWVLDPLDQHFSRAQVDAMPKPYQDILLKYCYRDPKGLYVLCWDHARFVNHSFLSNCISTAYDCEIAVRDIAAGEELTDDYGYLNVWEPFHAAHEEGSDRSTVYPDDLLRFHRRWDAQLDQAFPALHALPQPLMPYLGGDTSRSLLAISRGEETMRSILSCYYAGEAAADVTESIALPGTL